MTEYPEKYIKSFRMEDGKEVILRPIKPEDAPLEAEMFGNFSEETQRFRFFEPVKATPEVIKRYTNIDYDREMAIIAEVNENGKKKMAGVVRLIADNNKQTAELAVVVADPWQKKGLGNELVDYMLKIAKEMGIKKIYADLLKSNYVVRHMLEKRGFEIIEQEKENHAELELR
ncbi:GNAT family N-acetyltransferase [Candidatus Woesearchaeota archaeon]|nr:GNAT family N-acetyltransferase [Candidatus Woesearchaeota archaeon]